ncbi:DUF3667 domain-containing protein [Allosphingosinicella indica]|uniref:DUF3667 domain-containing protein n=1 Tax=Allosphingosinicella indica TaxID=941907 RepID=A0A1X7FZC4_9SPHN|nr:DUF3667 domain-containing protein [Allosphingosinicella indica]SMF61366.1 Protein of unknown function [Allosphingosinicella indica]
MPGWRYCRPHPAIVQEFLPIFRWTDRIVRDAGAVPPIPPVPVDPSWFAAPVCRNCGAVVETPHCPQCGQKKAKRFVWRDLGKETWERLRFFEIRSARTIGRLILAPGAVAREYVMGRRSAHMHPLTLLIALVAILVLVLAANRYFEHYAFPGRDSEVDRMAERVMAYANWSFSIGIFAIFFGSWIGFGRRLGYNAIEHAVLAVYCQILILAFIIVNLLPTLVWRSPEFVLWHKAASQYYVPLVKLLIVAAAYRQFFLLDLRTDWLRLLSACLIYLALGWALLRLYAMAILWLVSL